MFGRAHPNTPHLSPNCVKSVINLDSEICGHIVDQKGGIYQRVDFFRTPTEMKVMFRKSI